MCWDGKYYVTIVLPNGRVKRVDASRPLPPGNITIAATDNGMLPRRDIADTLKRIRQEFGG